MEWGSSSFSDGPLVLCLRLYICYFLLNDGFVSVCAHLKKLSHSKTPFFFFYNFLSLFVCLCLFLFSVGCLHSCSFIRFASAIRYPSTKIVTIVLKESQRARERQNMSFALAVSERIVRFEFAHCEPCVFVGVVCNAHTHKILIHFSNTDTLTRTHIALANAATEQNTTYTHVGSFNQLTLCEAHFIRQRRRRHSRRR